MRESSPLHLKLPLGQANPHATAGTTHGRYPMQLERPSSQSDRSGTVPVAVDARLLLLIVGVAALAASLNVPYGGQPAAVAAFAVLTVGGTVAHLLGERRLRRLTEALVDEWVEAGARVEDVTKSASGYRTEWTVHTADGPVTVGGLALAPISRLSVTWRGTGDEVPAAVAGRELDRYADDWHAEIFEMQ